MDFNINEISVFEESIGKSIDTYLGEENKINSTVKNIQDFVAYLQGQLPNISKYKSVESDIVKYLAVCEFSGKSTFDAVMHCCDTLPGLEDKIIQINKTVEPLLKRPDRYDVASVISSCETFTKYVTEKMTMSDVDKAHKKSSTIIKNLKKVTDAFQSEDDLLAEINCLIKENDKLLKKYPLYAKELKSYISAYPHDNNEDMQYVKEHLKDLSDIDAKFGELKKEQKLISKYADRHDKNTIESKSKVFIQQGAKKLIHSDISQVTELIKEALLEIENVKNNFLQDEKDFQIFHKELQDSIVDIWEEDFDLINTDVKDILDKGSCYVDFSIDEFIKRKDYAVQKKSYEVKDIFSRYNFLNRSRYKKQISHLLNVGISYDGFVGEINKIIKSRGFFVRMHEAIFW